MDSRKLALLVGALVLAGVSAFGARSLFTGQGAPGVMAAPPPVPTGPEVAVSNKALPVGTIIVADMLGYKPWPKELVDKAYFIKGEAGGDVSALVGTVVRYPITAGQPVTQGTLVKPGDRGFLAAALGAGMRAVTVKVDDRSGVAGFVFPGDRVDIVLTQDVSGGGDGPSLKASETIMRNVRVLATDQRTDHSSDEQGKTVVATFGTVTLEVTPKIAEKIAVAQKIGDLSLSLRSIADTSFELERAIASGEVSVPAGTDPKAERQMLLEVASRPMDGEPTYTVGGDVSRFQRRTVPSRVSLAPPAPAPASAPPSLVEARPRPAGPVVRIARGNDTTEVPVGGK